MRRRARLPAVLVLIGSVAGCADFQPFTPPVAGEIPPGPGLFSGPDGAFVITPNELADQSTAEAPPPAEPPPPPRRGLRLPPPNQDLTLPPLR